MTMMFQDNPQNILGANSANNQFDSSAVVANEDGSMIERIEALNQVPPKTVKVDLAAANLTGTTTRFTVSGGPVVIKHLGMHITTVLPAGANTLKFSTTPTGGAATDLCAATDTDAAVVNSVFLVDGVKATALVKSADAGIGLAGSESGMPIIVVPGVIQTIFSAGPPATGAAILFVEYEPLVPGAKIA